MTMRQERIENPRLRFYERPLRDGNRDEKFHIEIGDRVPVSWHNAYDDPLWVVEVLVSVINSL